MPYVMSLLPFQSRILRTLASCAFHTATGRLVAMSHNTTQPSASLLLAIHNFLQIPADEACVVSDEAETCDFGDVAPEDVDWLWREIVRVDKPVVALNDAHGIAMVGGRRFWPTILRFLG
jgi:hypothetical protein